MTMKCALFYFCAFLIIHENKGQTFCSGISISFNLTGDYCGVFGNINVYHNSTTGSVLAGFSDVINDKFSGDLCVTLNNSLSVSTNSSQCFSFDPLTDSGNFKLNLAICDVPFEVFQNFSVFYNKIGLYSDSGTCESMFYCNNILPTTPTTSLSNTSATTALTIGSTSTSPSNYIPCQSWISFNIDDSNILSTDNYNKQLNFISSAIGDINHPERIQAIGAYEQPVFWNSPFSIADIQTAVKALPQEGAYRLRQQFAELLTGLESIQTNNVPVGAIIFISDTSDAALQDASAVFSLIQNVRITFVLLGPNTDQNKLTNFSSNFINWKDLSQPLPDNWSNLYGTAYGCSEGISTVSPISTVTTVLPSSSSVTSPTQTVSSSSSVTTASQTPITATTSSTSSAGDYVPCQVLITTLVDISNALSIDQFQKQLTFTKNFITQINHLERIQYGAYYEGNGNMTYKWNDTNTQAGLLQAIDDTKQTSLPTSLAGAMRVLSNNAPQNRTIQDSTIIFVTDTTNSIEIQQAVNLYNSLLKPRGVRLTFIVAGNKTDVNALRGFNDTIFFNWQNMSNSQPYNWDLSRALGCTIVPYIPCQSWISFGVDDSNVLDPNSFTKHLNFISNAIGNITHPERIAAIGAYSQPVTWNSGLTISQIQQAVVGMFRGGPYSLKQQFAAILTNLQNAQTSNVPVGALIFISDTSDQALADVANIFGQLQNVRITFVLVGQNPDQNKLTQFSNNFISWRDLSKPQPDNWNNLYGPAYGCQNVFANVSYYKNHFDASSPHSYLSKTIPSILTSLLLSVDDYCLTSISTTPFNNNSTATSSFISSTPNPNAIVPPLPVIDCNDPNNSYIIKQTCIINGTSNSTTISQVINATSAHIQEKIYNNSFTATNVHDTGIFIFNTVTTVNNLDTDGAHKFLDITNLVVIQPLEILSAANNITTNSLLWYPSSLPKVIAKTEKDLNYSKPDSNILVHSFTLNDSFCKDAEHSHEVCYSSTSQVTSGDKNAEFCTTFNPKNLCNSAHKAYLTMWRSLSFFALVKNNSMNIKTGLENKQTPNQPTTFDNADKCSQGTYYKNNYGSNVGGVYSNGEYISTESSIWIKRREDENDLHIKNYKMAKFVVTSFEDSGNKVTKSDKHYTAQCPDGTCTLVVDGNPTEPIICSSGAKTTTALVSGIGIFLAVVGVFAVLAQSEAVPIVGRVLKIFFSIFGDKNLPMRLKFFACCYNFTFMLYSIYSIFISQQTISDTSENMCTIFAIVGYVLYISAIFLSVIMMMITLDALGCWKPTLKNTFYIFTGNKRNFIPFLHSYGIPLIITGIFAIALKSFFKRNDGYCWIRPDYAILALWFPLILLFLTIPLYIILFARRWSNFGFSKIICAPLIVQEDFDAYEEKKKKREEQDKQEKLKEFTEKLFGKSANGGNDNDEGEKDKTNVETIILTNETLARLIIPQIFLAVPLIAENLALYYSELTGWHYLFILTQALQLIVLNAMDWLTELPEKLEFVRAAFDAIKGKPKEEKSDDTKWGTNSQSRETAQF